MPFILPISSAFAHTHCISPSVCLLKSFMQASTFAPSPFSARASAIRSRTCGRQRLAFLAVSSTGGARKPNPSEGGGGAPAPRTELTHCGKEDSNERNPSGVSFVLVQVAFALQRRGEGAPAPCIQSPLWHSHIKMCAPCAHIYYSLFVLQNVPAWRAHFRVNFRKRRNFVSPICVRCRRQPLSAGQDYREQDPRLRQRSQEHFLLCKPAYRSLWKPACRCCAAGFRRR